MAIESAFSDVLDSVKPDFFQLCFKKCEVAYIFQSAGQRKIGGVTEPTALLKSARFELGGVVAGYCSFQLVGRLRALYAFYIAVERDGLNRVTVQKTRTDGFYVPLKDDGVYSPCLPKQRGIDGFYRVGHYKLRVFGSAVQVIYIHKLAAVGGVKGKPAHEKAFAIGGKIDGAVVLAVQPIDETELEKGVRLYFAERSGEVQLKRAVEKSHSPNLLQARKVHAGDVQTVKGVSVHDFYRFGYVEEVYVLKALVKRRQAVGGDFRHGFVVEGRGHAPIAVKVHVAEVKRAFDGYFVGAVVEEIEVKQAFGKRFVVVNRRYRHVFLYAVDGLVPTRKGENFGISPVSGFELNVRRLSVGDLDLVKAQSVRVLHGDAEHDGGKLGNEIQVGVDCRVESKRLAAVFPHKLKALLGVVGGKNLAAFFDCHLCYDLAVVLEGDGHGLLRRLGGDVFPHRFESHRTCYGRGEVEERFSAVGGPAFELAALFFRVRSVAYGLTVRDGYPDHGGAAVRVENHLVRDLSASRGKADEREQRENKRRKFECSLFHNPLLPPMD